MGSRYDPYWQERLSELADLAAVAADGHVARLDVHGITARGDRRSWQGSARVCGRVVLDAHMAHMRSLGNVLTVAGALDRWPDREFLLSVNNALLLTMRADGINVVRRASRSTARGRVTAATRTSIANTSRLLNPADACAEVHALLAGLPAFSTPSDVPFTNGLYFFYEHGESSVHGLEGRVVRVGNHPRGQDRLVDRLRDHYATRHGAKNGSVFRRYLGGALLRRDDASSTCLMPGLGAGHWEHQDAGACPTCAPYEERVTDYLQARTRFRCIRVDDREERNRLEARLIASLAACPHCRPSAQWLGHHCYAPAVKRTGLWNAQHVDGEPLEEHDLTSLRRLAGSQDPDTGTHDLSDTLLIIPCSASKRGVQVPVLPLRVIRDFLSDDATAILEEGRRLAFTKTGTRLDEDSPLRPALAGYTGQPYATPGFRELLIDALGRGLHCLIVSGGYGLLRPEEPIHFYGAHMPTQTRSVWEGRLRALLPDYVARNGIRRVFLTVSNAYARCLPPALGVEQEWRSIPAFDRTRDAASAMRVVPGRIGAAATALLANDLVPGSDWIDVRARRAGTA